MNELDASSLLAIVSNLDKPADLLHAAQATTALASVCKAQYLWQQLLERKFDLIISAPAAASPAQGCLPAAAPHPSAAAAAPTAAAAASSAPLDLQETFKALATAPPPGALRFAAVFTDGGCDGMKEQDKTYWADHAFQPNPWSPHCSDGQANINIIGLLHPYGLPGDERLSTHCKYLVERCAAAAAVLFSPPHSPRQTLEEAAQALGNWSTTGLERLFMDLYQDLWMHQQDSTWGRFLLSGLPQSDWPAEFERMAATAESIQADFRHATYQGVANVPQHEIEAAAAAAATAGCSSGCSSAWPQRQRQRQRRNTTSSDITPEQDTAAAAAPAVADETDAGADAMALDVPVSVGSRAQSGAAAAATAAAAGHLRLSSLKQGLRQAQQEQQALQRHMVDKQLLPWFTTPALTQCTGLIEEIVMSRLGHFTCPVAAGAVFLAQHPTLPSSSSSSGSSAESAQMQAMLRVQYDPLVAALNNMISFEQVQQAISTGELPPLLQHQQSNGAEWCEFAPLSSNLRQQRQQQGWYMRPIVWFRFSTPEQAPVPAEHAYEAGQAAAEAAAAAGAGDDVALAAAATVAQEAGFADMQADIDVDIDSAAMQGSESGLNEHHDAMEVTDDDSASDDVMTVHMELPPVGWEAFGQHPQQQQPTQQQQQQQQPMTSMQHADQQQQQQQHAPSNRNSRKAPWQQRGVAGVSVLPAPASVHEVDHSAAAAHMLLRMRLSAGPRSGNMTLLKLISCEDKMAEYEDPSEEPNIDVQYVALRGVCATLDPTAGLQLL